jgi:orotidine-5'-phosphate decarboxylase
VAKIRQEAGDDTGFLIVTPGIRPGVNRDIEKDDQKRIATAKDAIINGADHVVIGRPISTSPDPLGTISQIQEEIEDGCRALDSKNSSTPE